MSIYNDPSITRKRTRDDAEETEVDKRPFIIKDPSNPFARPRSFTPICLLSRAQLPLASLDTNQSGSRLFSAHLPILESCCECGDETSTLIAQEHDERRLYAIERVKRRCYALCRLGDCVTKAELIARSKTVLQIGERQPKKQALSSVEDGQSQVWWKRAAVDLPEMRAAGADASAWPKLAMNRVMEGQQKGTKPTNSPTVLEPSPLPSELVISEDIPAIERHISPQDVLEDLAKHYLDTLYISRTSLAYFTKGPLSRARVAVSAPGGQLTLSELIQFLRDSILGSTVMDKKYKDGLAETVKAVPVRDAESPSKTPKPRKKRRKWKSKRDKSGFFIDEHEYVERWWRVTVENEFSPSSAETADAVIRRRLVPLRSRETFLQIILLLEVLALEATTPSPIEESHVPGTDVDVPCEESQPAAAEPKKAKAKRKQDLPCLLENLLDKLCIWHSLESHSPAKKVSNDQGIAPEETNDELKSFCIEIIVPFYNSRIPQYATIANKKLGGPSAPSPMKRNPVPARRPGEPATRQPPERTIRKPLARVATDTSTRFANASIERPPSLHRSTTDSETLPQIKREGSEISLDSVPLARVAVQEPRRRTSLTTQLHAFSKREVDLSAISASNEAKMRKKKDVEAKLKEAVEMLKKPNRALAVKEVEERTDEKFAFALKKSRPRAHHARSERFVSAGEGHNIHVTATPKRGRAMKATPSKPTNNEAAGLTKSSTTHVTSSSTRLHATQSFDAFPGSTPAIPQTGHRPRHVQETPSRGFAKFMPAGLARQPGTMLESPVSSRMVLQTPSKSVQPLLVSSPNVARMAVGRSEEGESVYERLGWDDAYEELG